MITGFFDILIMVRAHMRKCFDDDFKKISLQIKKVSVLKEHDFSFVISSSLKKKTNCIKK